jgi:hypothetical protein
MPSVPPTLQPTLSGAARRFFPVVLVGALLFGIPMAAWGLLRATREETRAVISVQDAAPAYFVTRAYESAKFHAVAVGSNGIVGCKHRNNAEPIADQLVVIPREGTFEVRLRGGNAAARTMVLTELIECFEAERVSLDPPFRGWVVGGASTKKAS